MATGNKDLLRKFLEWLPEQWQWLGEVDPRNTERADALFKCMDYDSIIDRFLAHEEER